jgi:carbon monoxide dehydrogenase subunit G
MKIIQSITINAPIDHVFKTFTNIDTAAKTLTGIKQMGLIEGPAQMEVGTKWKETREMMGKDSTEVMWVSELTKNKSYTVDAESHGTKYRSTYEFTEKNGSTTVHWEFEGIPQTFAAKLMSIIAFPFMGPLKKMMFKDMEELKAACESK